MDQMNDSTAVPETPAPKQAINICVCKNGQVILRQGEASPRKRLLVPLNLSGDTRFFVKNGEIVRPFVTFNFALRRTMDISGIDVSLYHEESMAEFDPTDMVPIGVRSLDKDFDELNAAQL